MKEVEEIVSKIRKKEEELMLKEVEALERADRIIEEAKKKASELLSKVEDEARKFEEECYAKEISKAKRKAKKILGSVKTLEVSSKLKEGIANKIVETILGWKDDS